MLAKTTRSENPLISIVAPVLDEEDCIAEFVKRIRAAAIKAGVRYEILLIDDGSTDETPQRIAAERNNDPCVKTIRLSRSFGHQAALTAGLNHAIGDAVVTMDGDLQHPPETIPEMIMRWREGADVVHTIFREGTKRRRPLSERIGRLFYPVVNLISNTPVIATSGDFRLLDRRTVDAFNSLDEHFVFIRGLIPWLGFSQATVEYDLAERFAGARKYSPAQMSRLALDGIFSFSVVPLRMITLLGLATTLFGFVYGIASVISYFMGRVADGGWTSIVCLILIFGGVQLLSLGIVSEYIGRIYEESKRRPRYIIDSASGVDTTDS